jgi:hypothetical protein
MNIQDNNIDRNNEPNSEDNVFEELDVPFTEPELERGICLGSLTSPFLNTGIIILCTHNSGSIPVFYNIIKMFSQNWN